MCNVLCRTPKWWQIGAATYCVGLYDARVAKCFNVMCVLNNFSNAFASKTTECVGMWWFMYEIHV